MAKVHLEDKYINFVRNSIDLVVGNTGYPVLANTLTQTGVATRQQIRSLEGKGLIKGIDVRVPSQIVPGSYSQFRAYYTERNVPQYVKDLEAEKTTSEE